MIALIILLILDIYILYKTGSRRQPKEVAGKGKTWTVYGTMGCGWTLKQLEWFKKSGKSYKFVDCDKEGCPGMEAFPTLISPKGEKIVGYKEV